MVLLTKLCNKTMDEDVFWERAQLLHTVCCWQSILCSTSYEVRGNRIARHMGEDEEETDGGSETETTDLDEDDDDGNDGLSGTYW